MEQEAGIYFSDLAQFNALSSLFGLLPLALWINDGAMMETPITEFDLKVRYRVYRFSADHLAM